MFPRKPTKRLPAQTLETAEVDGFRIRYLRRGEGAESTILIHGFGGDLNTWMFNHEALASGNSVYALDLPGHGSSSKQVGDGSLEGLAKVLEGFIDSIGAEKVHLAGHSMGGAVAAIFAVNHPERCLSLTLIASAGLGPEIDGEYIRGFVSATRRNETQASTGKAICRLKVDHPAACGRYPQVQTPRRGRAGFACDCISPLPV